MKAGFLKNLTLKEVTILDKTITMLMNYVANNQPSKEKRKRSEVNKRYYDKRFKKYNKGA